MTDSAWKPYTPTQAAPWNLRRVVHLHLRAGFAAPWPDLQRDLSEGPQASVERLIAGRARQEPEGYAERAERLFQTAAAGNRPAELAAAWLYRMLYGPDPLGERLTLMWHNHFATSNEKVDNSIVMVRQNALFRELARAPFGELLNRAVRDPALLAFLDAQLNSQDHPNENLARELMELFTVGVGHYTEADVREAARTLTGWTLERPWSASYFEDRSLTRRRFLQTNLIAAPLVAFTSTTPAFLAQVARAETQPQPGRVVVIVELAGGNDGINTIVPYSDDGYARARTTLRLPKERLIRINDQVGLHPALRPLADSWEAGNLAIVQGVGYPNPSRSHFVSQAIWHTAETDTGRHQGVGWIGRGLDASADRLHQAVFIGAGSTPVALRGRLIPCMSVERPGDFRLAEGLPPRGPASLTPPQELVTGDDALAFVRRTALDASTSLEALAQLQPRATAASRYPASSFGQQLELSARAIKAGLRASVYYLAQDSYDTHVQQLGTQAALLSELASGWRAFLADLAEAGLADRVILLAFSEFGRRVEENASEGTDHGTAGPVFIAGGMVQGGLVGQTPSLTDLEDGDLKVGLDFRCIYATVLQDWLGVTASVALGSGFVRLPLLRG